MHISLFLAVLTGILVGCNRIPNYDERLVKADNLVYEHPDQAKDILLKINPKELNEADAAYYNLLFTQASYINYDNLTSENDSIITRSLDYYNKHKGDKEKLTRTYIYKGAVTEELGLSDSLAMVYYKTAEHFADKDDHFNRGYAQLRMGSLYKNSNAYDGRDIEKYRYAVNSFRADNNKHYLILALKDLGTLYRFREPEKAEETLKEAITLAKNEKDTNNYVISTSLLAYLYYMQGDNSKAIKQLQPLNSFNLTGYGDPIYSTFACVYANNNKVDSAFVFLDMAKQQHNNDSSFYKSYHYLLAMSQIAKARGNMPDYYRLSHECDSIDYSIRMNPAVVNIMNSEINCATSFEVAKVKERLIGYSIMAGLMLLLLLLALLFYRRSHRYDKLVLELKDQSRSQLNDLTDMQQNISELKINDERLKGFITSHMDMMREMIDACYHEPNNRIAENLKRIVKFQDSNRDNWVKLYDYIDLEHNNIMTRTREQYPQLNDKDLLLLALTCMGYSYIQTAIIMGYSNATSVSVLKQRLAKKMGLEGTLNEYIEQNSNVKIE